MAWGPLAWGRKERKEQARHLRTNRERALLAEGYRDADDAAADEAGSAAEAMWEAMGGLEPRTFTVSGTFGEIDHESLCADLVGSPVSFDGDGWPDEGVVTAAAVVVAADGLARLALSVDLADGRTAEVVL